MSHFSSTTRHRRKASPAAVVLISHAEHEGYSHVHPRAGNTPRGERAGEPETCDGEERLRCTLRNLHGATTRDVRGGCRGGEGCTRIEELHEDSIPAIESFRQLVKLMHACGVYDVSIWDYVRPTAERFKRNLSAIINLQSLGRSG